MKNSTDRNIDLFVVIFMGAEVDAEAESRSAPRPASSPTQSQRTLTTAASGL